MARTSCPYHANPKQATGLRWLEHCSSGGVETRETSLITRKECAMSAKDKNLKDLFLDTLKDIYYAEKQIFELIDKPARGKTCDAIQGILDEGKEIMDEYKGCEALDAGMLAAAQAVEHYEISRYGTLKQWATQLGMKDAVKLLDQTLQEEKKTDESLTTLAEAAVNLAAAA